MRKNDAFDAKIVNTRLTNIFIAIFAPDERLPSSATQLNSQYHHYVFCRRERNSLQLKKKSLKWRWPGWEGWAGHLGQFAFQRCLTLLICTFHVLYPISSKTPLLWKTCLTPLITAQHLRSVHPWFPILTSPPGPTCNNYAISTSPSCLRNISGIIQWNTLMKERH